MITETEEAGKCPKCGILITYTNPFQLSDSAGYFAYDCTDCGFEGREWYNLVFTEHQAVPAIRSL